MGSCSGVWLQTGGPSLGRSMAREASGAPLTRRTAPSGDSTALRVSRRDSRTSAPQWGIVLERASPAPAARAVPNGCRAYYRRTRR